jgi:signal transduction histidine kinase
MKKKKYQPHPIFNPAVQAKKLDKLAIEIDRNRKTIQALSKSYDNHISYLGNFTRHDIKNAILSMDSILSTNEPEEFTREKISSLSIFLDVIRETIENFSKLVPYSTNGKFKLEALFIAVELLSRADMQNHKIDLILDFERTSKVELDFPFQSLLQMINNLIINSIKALESTPTKKIILEGKLDEKELRIKISDNGIAIPETNRCKIFDYGFSTTDGSGIGLYHAKYLCERIDGDIFLDLNIENGMTKTFCITLPVIEDGKDNSDN